MNNLRVMRIKLGSGWVLGGYHTELPGAKVKFSSLTNAIRSGTVAKKPHRRVNNVSHCMVPYQDPEDINITLPRRCNQCLNCQNCLQEVQGMSHREKEELELIRANITFDKE